MEKYKKKVESDLKKKGTGSNPKKKPPKKSIEEAKQKDVITPKSIVVLPQKNSFPQRYMFKPSDLSEPSQSIPPHNLKSPSKKIPASFGVNQFFCRPRSGTGENGF
jgi:hypothetical protein